RGNHPPPTAWVPGASGGRPPGVGRGQPTSGGPAQPSTPASTQLDSREHPSWRVEMLQRVLNLTSVRTHQYAVWITVGFFEVKRRGEVGMIAAADPRSAFDILGREIGLGGEPHRP